MKLRPLSYFRLHLPRHIRNHRILWIFIGLLVMVILFGSWRFYELRSSEKKVKARRGPITEAVYALGTVRSDRVYSLKMGMLSRIDHIYAAEGDRLTAASPLARVNGSLVLRAPFSGTITRLYAREGENVNPGTPVLTMMDLDALYVELSVDQESAMRLRAGQSVELSFESIRSNRLKGTIKSVYPSESQFLVRVEVSKMPEGILPNMTADAAVSVARREDVLLIPVSALKHGTVVLYRNGKRLTVQVKTGAVNGTLAEVTDDSVLETDTLVINGR